MAAVERGRWYPEMPPALPGETDDQYTDRLTGADGTDRRPYDHPRNRQCSIGYHDECSDPDGERCKCPCHTAAATLSTIVEPDDRVAVYWPCTAEVFSTLVLRDDATAARLGHPERRWFEPNADEEAQTWREVLAAIGRQRLDLADAVLFFAPSNGAEMAKVFRHG